MVFVVVVVGMLSLAMALNVGAVGSIGCSAEMTSANCITCFFFVINWQNESNISNIFENYSYKQCDKYTTF